ncbi:MAG TPA: thioredoxin-disulfide reductase [Planctomycetota bacterium]|nr:thioredoxin-disulfide reductase [Planctomycetota bacterium]
MSDPIRNTVIVGSGPAGLTAAIYTARANLGPLVLGGANAGGQLMTTSEVENYPGFRKGILGPQLMDDMMAQAAHCGAEMVYEDVAAIDTSARPFTVTYAGGKKVKTHTVIFATGAAPRTPGLPSEKNYCPPKGTGLHTCAVCDGSFYRKMPIAVVGGGDSAMEEATYLAKICSSVTIIHRREEFRASKVMLDRARANPNIKWELNQIVDDVLGDPAHKPVPIVTGVRLKHAKTGAIKELKIEALFIAIGHVPTTDLLRGQVEFDKDGYIVVNEHQETKVPGLFAAGDCHDRHYRQAVTAAGMGCIAALETERYLTREGLA